MNEKKKKHYESINLWEIVVNTQFLTLNLNKYPIFWKLQLNTQVIQ